MVGGREKDGEEAVSDLIADLFATPTPPGAADEELELICRGGMGAAVGTRCCVRM